MLKAFDFTDLLTPNAKQLTTGFDFSDLSTIQRDMSSQTATDDVIITASQSPLMPSACEVANTVASMKTENMLVFLSTFLLTRVVVVEPMGMMQTMVSSQTLLDNVVI